MIANKDRVVGELIGSTVIGAGAGMIFAASLMTLDVAGIGTMMSTATAKALMLTLFLGGSATKGAAFGFAFSLAGLARKQRAPRPALTPALAVKSS